MKPEEARQRFENHWQSFSGNALAIHDLCKALLDDPATCEELMTEFHERYRALRDHMREDFEAAIRENNFKVLAGEAQ